MKATDFLVIAGGVALVLGTCYWLKSRAGSTASSGNPDPTKNPPYSTFGPGING